MGDILDNILENFKVYLKSSSDISFVDFIDVFLVALCIYFFLNWTKNTRSWSLIKGIFILLALWFVFSAFGFATLAWILSNVFKVGGWVAAIVLFQPELRKALEELGKGKFISADTSETSHINTEIVNALKIMANDSVGALVCIEQSVALGDYEKTGIILDAKISSQLLVSIFYDKNPLHDGAVIFRKNRVAAAGCILPVTSMEIGKELGTRHRAAVGLSEFTDAIIIVVSEETGGVSMARNGRLTRNVHFDDIFDILQRTSHDEDINGIKNSLLSKLKGEEK